MKWKQISQIPIVAPIIFLIIKIGDIKNSYDVVSIIYLSFFILLILIGEFFSQSLDKDKKLKVLEKHIYHILFLIFFILLYFFFAEIKEINIEFLFYCFLFFLLIVLYLMQKNIMNQKRNYLNISFIIVLAISLLLFLVVLFYEIYTSLSKIF